MKRRVFAICSVLIAAIVVVAAVPGCAPAGEGTIEVKAIDLCVPEAWEGLVTYTLSSDGQADVTGSSVPGSHTVAPGTWSIEFEAGGPPNAWLSSITPTASQTVADGGTKTFTFNLARNLTPEVAFITWTINGVPVESGWAPMPVYNVTVGDVIGMEFQQRVRGCPGVDITVNETAWFMMWYWPPPGDPIPPLWGELHFADNACAVEKVPTYAGEARTEKLSQQLTVFGDDTDWAYPWPACTSFNFTDETGNWLLYGYPQIYPTSNLTMPSLILDENSMWGLETGPLYDKTINWLTFGYHVRADEDCVLFQITQDAPQWWPAIYIILAGINIEVVDPEGGSVMWGPPSYLPLNVVFYPWQPWP